MDYSTPQSERYTRRAMLDSAATNAALRGARSERLALLNTIAKATAFGVVLGVAAFIGL